MAKVKIKAKDSRKVETKNKLLDILSRHDIYATRIIPNNDGFVVLTLGDADLDRIFDGTTNTDLTNNGLTPTIPPELRANRSVVIFKVDMHIFQNAEDDMIGELEGKNDWIQKVIQIYKFPKGNTIKITFSSTAEARKAQEVGLKLYSMRIPHYDIKQDKFHNITTCFKCYMLEDHYTNQCPKNDSYKLCSECGELGHIWRDCTSEQKSCPNCQGDHNAMAMKCPQRKDILSQKRKEEKERSKTTYTGALKKNIQTTTSNTVNTDLSETNRHDLMYLCTLHAHYKNIKRPGTYEKELNIMLTANRFPTLIVPEDPPSLEIITAINREHQRQRKESKDKKRAREEESDSDESDENVDIMEASVIEEEVEDAPKQKNTQKPKKSTYSEGATRKTDTLTGLEIGLMIAAKKSESGILPKEISRKNLIRGIEGKKLKYTYEEESIEEEELLKLIETNKIDLTDCFTVIEDAIFDKVRSGLIRKMASPNEFEKKGKRSKDSQTEKQ